MVPNYIVPIYPLYIATNGGMHNTYAIESVRVEYFCISTCIAATFLIAQLTIS